MSATYPNPCTHCGFCCIAQQCPASIAVHGKLARGVVCPSLSFTGNKSSCALVAKFGPEIMGSGVGCCISAQVVIQGKAHDFASLPEDVKIAAVRQIKARPGLVFDKRTLEPVA